MAAQAFIDDSGNEPDGEILVLAGFIAPTKSWEQFAIEWSEALRISPSVNYFKASEAMQLRKQFSKANGWTDELRNERLVVLSDLIRQYATVAISASIKHADFRATIQNLPNFGSHRPASNDSPYNLVAHFLMTRLWLESKQHLLPGPCEFVFDRQLGFEQPAVKMWSTAKRIMADAPTGLADWMIGPPRFEDDKAAVPLQAADFYAWAVRRGSTRHFSQLKLPLEVVENLTSLPQMHLNFSRRYLEGQYRRYSRVADEVHAANRDIPMQFGSRKRAERLPAKRDDE